MFNLIILLGFLAAVLNIILFENKSPEVEDESPAADLLFVLFNRSVDAEEEKNSQGTNVLTTMNA